MGRKELIQALLHSAHTDQALQIFDPYWEESEWQYPPEVGKNGYIGSATTMRDSNEYWFFDPDIQDKDDTIPFPLMRVPRGFWQYWWFGRLANGTRIAPGKYT